MSSPVFLCVIVEHHFLFQPILHARNLVNCTKVSSVVGRYHLGGFCGALLIDTVGFVRKFVFE
jgi:hypothetical protein